MCMDLMLIPDAMARKEGQGEEQRGTASQCLLPISSSARMHSLTSTLWQLTKERIFS